jgi:phage protein D/phage baseplate assembly protein gpV
VTVTDTFAPRAEVRVSGLFVGADLTNQLISVSFDNNVDLADMFTLVFRNADNSLTDSPLFALGNEVELHMGYGDRLEPMIYGEITSLQPSFPQSGPPALTVAGYDRSYKLRHNEPDRAAFKYMTDSMIAAQIAVEAGLVPIADPSPFFHEEIQQTGTDFAFLKERAKANFFDVYVEWDRLHFKLPRPQTEAVVLEWGKNLSSFTPRLSSAGAAGLQVVRGYNEELAQTVVGIATAAELDLDEIVERLGSAALDALLSLGRRVARHRKVKSPVDAALLARSLLNEILEGLYEGSGSTVGLPRLRAGDFVTIRGLGKRFSGRYRLKKVTHRIDDGGYRTDFEVTQRSSSSLLQLIRKSVSETSSPNGREPFYGLAVGKVTKNVDELGLGRVRVHLPWFSDEGESAWARCVTPMAGAGRGMYFLPDEGDEVVVAFLRGNFDEPVVIGGVWNGQMRPPVVPARPKNPIRTIKTEAGHSITLDDQLKKITIESASDLELKAPVGTISLDAKDVKVTVKTTMDVS